MKDLTDKQIEVLSLICNGLTNKEIAFELGISVKGVKFHLGNIYKNLGIHSREQAITKAFTRVLPEPVLEKVLIFPNQKVQTPEEPKEEILPIGNFPIQSI